MQTILVGYDDSEQAQRALDRAIELAKALGTEIVVASVAPVAISSGRSAGPIDPTDTPQQHRDQLQTAAEKVQAAGLVGEAGSRDRPSRRDDSSEPPPTRPGQT